MRIVIIALVSFILGGAFAELYRHVGAGKPAHAETPVVEGPVIAGYCADDMPEVCYASRGECLQASIHTMPKDGDLKDAPDCHSVAELWEHDWKYQDGKTLRFYKPTRSLCEGEQTVDIRSIEGAMRMHQLVGSPPTVMDCVRIH